MMRILVFLFCCLLHCYQCKDEWSEWSPCKVKRGSLDQNCIGTQKRVKDQDTERQDCPLTSEKINGGYTEWTKWNSCTGRCSGTTTRIRSCSNPTQCNGGNDCSEFGRGVLTKLCGPVAGQWAEWGNWGRCSINTDEDYGTGTRVRHRTCTDPAPECGGSFCVGRSNQTDNCRKVPLCLTEDMFNNRFHRIDTPMVIYISAQVDLYLLTKNLCDTNTLVYRYWLLYQVNDETGEEKAVVKERQYTAKFGFHPGEFGVGLFRLYAKIGYPYKWTMLHWMEESMYILIVQPPPHSFIDGGSGRTVGPGRLDLDARSVSFSLTKRPGDPSGLQFQWKCVNFFTYNIYKLLEFNLEFEMVFKDKVQSNTNWYETKYLHFVEDTIAFFDGTEFYNRIVDLKTSNATCLTADQIKITVLESYVIGNVTKQRKVQVPFSDVYSVRYMYEFEANNIDLIQKNVGFLPLSWTELLIQNEFLEFINIVLNAHTVFADTDIFLEALADSSKSLNTLYEFRHLEGLPEKANATFFEILLDWLENANQSTDSIEALNIALQSFMLLRYQIYAGKDSIGMIGVDNFFLWSTDEYGLCLLDYLINMFDSLKEVNSYDWAMMKEQEISYLNWLENEMLNVSKCAGFTGFDDGTGSLNVTDSDIQEGKGFLVYIRVQFEMAISYFVQHLQSVEIHVPQLSIECRFNCMEKTALTSIASFRAYCDACSVNDKERSIFSWEIKHFDLYNRQAKDSPDWQSWVLSDINSPEFVINANVLNASEGYLVEVYMELDGAKSMAVWIITANMLPYGGGLRVEDGPWGEVKIITEGWMDEGFRSVRNVIYDGKEQLSYRIMQISSDGKETLLYYGWEEENFITVKPGIPADNYDVIIYVQVYDIFLDYAEVSTNLGRMLPKYSTSNDSSVDMYLADSENTIDYYWKTGNMKQVAMNAEVAGMSVQEMSKPRTVYDADPSDWRNLGVDTLANGTTITKTFDELWDMFLNPYSGDNATMGSISQHLEHFVEIMTNASADLGVTSTLNVNHMIVGLGTLIQNKDLNADGSVVESLVGNEILLEKLLNLSSTETYPKYEDYIKTCEGFLRLLNNALEGILPKYSSDSPESLDMYTILEDMKSREEIDGSIQTDLTDMEKAFIVSQIAMKNEFDLENQLNSTKEDVELLLKNIDVLSEILRSIKFRKQLAVDVGSSHIHAREDSKMIFNLLQSGVTNSDGVNVHFSGQNSYKEQRIRLTTYYHTPFAWDKSSRYIRSKTVTVGLGEDNITSSSVIPSKIKLPNNNINGMRVLVAIPDDKQEFSSQLIILKLYWKNPTDSLMIEVRNASNEQAHTIYISRKGNPTESSDFMKVVGPEDWITGKNIKVIVSPLLYSKPTTLKVGLLIENSNSSGSSSTYTRKRRSTAISNFEYVVVAATVGCRVWDSENDRWENSSCTLSPLSTLNETVCECKDPPGRSFASTFYVPPNTIDFGSVFKKFDLKDNAAVFATVISLVVVYLLICIWAFRQDKKDQQRWSLSYLVDNSMNDDYLYIVSVYTGLRRNAGTSSNVQFMIFGGTQEKNKKNSSDTDIRSLDDGTKKGFEVGSVRKFVMSVPKRIRDPTVMKVWHDNSGAGHSASWYLDKVILEDVQTSERFIFICNRWLSLDHDDGSIECVIPASNEQDTHKFSFLFDENAKENTTNNHLWLSVAVRPEQTNFSRIERLACCLALLFLTMITNAMFFGQDTGYRVIIGPVSFSLSGLYISLISALIVAPPIFIVTCLFRNSKGRSYSHKKQQKERNGITDDLSEDINAFILNVQFPLPVFCRYIAWLLVTMAVVVSGFFLILYSMEWGKSKSEEWLLCFCMSFVESMFVVDPLKIILLSCALSFIFKTKKNHYPKYNVEKLLVETKKRANTPLSVILGMFRKKPQPVDNDMVVNMKEKRKNELNVQESFVELILYICLLVVLYLISFNNRDMRWFHISNHIDQQLVTMNNVSIGDATLKLEQVSSPSTWYTWVDNTLLPFMFPRTDSSGRVLFANDRLFVKDNINFRVGPMRLRQVRSKEETCNDINWENRTCVDEYSIFQEEHSDFCVGWEGLPCAAGQSIYNMTSPAWSFTSSTDTWGLPVAGTHGTYGGGGYILDFVVNYKISRLFTEDLYKYMWIDRRTRAVFVEFTLYNADNNVFVYTSIQSEFPTTGGIISETSIEPFRPYQHVGDVGMMIFVLELILLVGMVIFGVKKCIHLYKNGKKFFKELWNVLDLIIVILFFACFAMYVGRWLMINSAMDKFKNDKNKFVNFSHIAVWDKSFNVLMAFLIFFTTFRIMRFLSYNDRINILGRVLWNVGYDLSGCFAMFSIVYAGFLIFGNLIFGRYLSTYRNLFVSSTTLINAIIGKNSINDLFSVEPVLGRFYYFFFVLFLLWILMTMLNATLNTGITAIRSTPSESSYGFINLMASIWQDTVGIILPSNRNGTKQLEQTPFDLPFKAVSPEALQIDQYINIEIKDKEVL